MECYFTFKSAVQYCQSVHWAGRISIESQFSFIQSVPCIYTHMHTHATNGKFRLVIRELILRLSMVLAGIISVLE